METVSPLTAGRALGDSECPLCGPDFRSTQRKRNLDACSRHPNRSFVVHVPAGRALGEADSECPLCGPGFRSTLDIRAAMQAGASEQVHRPRKIRGTVT